MPRSISSGVTADVRLVRLLLLEPIVDHPIEQLLVHLLLLHADDVRVARLRADLDAPGHRAVEQLGPEDRPLTDDGDDALDDRRARGRRHGRQAASTTATRSEQPRTLHAPTL